MTPPPMPYAYEFLIFLVWLSPKKFAYVVIFETQVCVGCDFCNKNLFWISALNFSGSQDVGAGKKQ